MVSPSALHKLRKFEKSISFKNHQSKYVLPRNYDIGAVRSDLTHTKMFRPILENAIGERLRFLRMAENKVLAEMKIEELES